MNKKERSKATTLFSLHLPIIALVFALAGTGAFFAYNVTKKAEDSVLGSTSKNNSNKSDKAVKVDKSQKPAVAQENSVKHVEKITGVAKNLQKVAEMAIEEGDDAVAEEIMDTAAKEEEIAKETAQAIEEIGAKPKWQVLLFGTDYKNIGTLRSSLAHNTNAVRKLTKNAETMEEGEGKAQLQEQIQVLNQERVRIQAVLNENEDQFSVFGWFIKLFRPEAEQPTDEVIETTESETIETEGTSDVEENEEVETDGTGIEE